MSGVLLAGSTSVLGIIGSVMISVCYMLLFFVIARKGSPLLNKWLNIKSDEVFIIVTFAALFFIAGFSELLHVAEAIGALLLGLVFSETEYRERIAHMVIPFRDFFGAIFFFSFGLTIDPATLVGAIWLALGAVLLTIAANFIAGLIAGRRAGLSYKASTNIGLTIVARGEFSIIVANLGVTAGLSPILTPFTALYVLLLAIFGPMLTKESRNVYRLLNKIFKWDKTPEKKTIKVPGE
jgi:CPA2 family monovalent cation:H+ antiporter-2